MRGERRTEIVSAKVTPRTQQMLKAAAAAAGITLSRWAAQQLAEAARQELERLACRPEKPVSSLAAATRRRPSGL